MDVNNLNPQEFVDIFGAKDAVIKDNQFGVTKFDASTDILDKEKQPVVEDKEKDKDKLVDDLNKDKDKENLDKEKDKQTDADILGDQDKNKDKVVTYDFKDASGYFADRIKSGKFIKIRQTNEKGEEVDFIPTKPEEFDEVFDLQLEHKLKEKEKDVAQSWYQSKTPAWQAIAKYAELVDNPADVIPFLQGVRTIESVREVDEGTVEGAEQIVRTRLEQKGDTPEIVQQQVELLKQTDKLIPTAKAYKPLIIKEEQTNLLALKKQEEERNRVYLEDVVRIEDGAIKAIDSPFYGKKLQKEEKAMVYDLIGYPSQESGGYKIFSIINSLFEKGDFETLAGMALYASNKDAFVNYISDKAAHSTASKLQNKLRLATENSSSKSTFVDDSEEAPVIQRRKFTSNFGR